MITLTARINLISANNGTLSDVLSEISKSNISSEIGAILGIKKQVANPFIFGASKFGDGSTFSDTVDYFIGSVPSVENPCELTISGKDIKSFTIAFDTANNRYPYYVFIDGEKYANDDAVFTANVPNANVHTIKIDNWNSPDYPLVITGIYVDISIDIDYRNLIALNRNITYRGDNKLPSYGIISNTGNLEFNDIDGEIKDYAEQMLLSSDLKVTINLNNTLKKASQQLGVFETETWDYDNDSRSVSVSLKDDLEDWQNIQVSGLNYDPRKPYSIIANGKMSNVYKWLQSKDENGNYRTPKKYEMLSFEELDNITKNILEKTTIEYPLLKDGNLWEQWQKLCEVCGLYIYKNNQGKTICRYTYGS